MRPLFPFRAFVLPLQGVNVRTLNTTSPFLTCLDFGVCNAIRLVRFGYNTFTGCVALRVAPTPPFPLKREPTASAPRGDTLSTRIDCYRSLVMPLRLRGGYATECHAFSYFSSSSALIFSPPCGSHFE